MYHFAALLFRGVFVFALNRILRARRCRRISRWGLFILHYLEIYLHRRCIPMRRTRCLFLRFLGYISTWRLWAMSEQLMAYNLRADRRVAEGLGSGSIDWVRTTCLFFFVGVCGIVRGRRPFPIVDMAPARWVG